jgi:hypothetical protein
MEEAFFVPCTRMHDIMRAWNVEHDHGVDGDEDGFLEYLFRDMDFEEVELRAGVGNSVDDFLHPNFTFDNFYQLARRKIVWMGPEIFVDALTTNADLRYALLMFGDCFEYGTLFSVRPATNLDTGRDNELQVCSRPVTDAAVTVCDYVLQLMTTSNTIWTQLEMNVLPSVSIHALSRFLSNSRSTGGTISFDEDYLSDSLQEHLRDYLRVLEVSTGPKHRIMLRHGMVSEWSQLLTVTLANFLQRCQCAIDLKCYTFPVPSLIIDALRGDCNIVELYLNKVPGIGGLVQALANNKSLVRLNFVDMRISDNKWTKLCRSLARHPKLEYLRLSHTFPRGPHQLSNERKTRRTIVFLKMLQTNTVLQELEIHKGRAKAPDDEFDDPIMADVIQPYFRCLRHVRALGNYCGPLYAQVLARALYKVNDSPALVWMLIRNNMSIVLEFEEDN